MSAIDQSFIRAFSRPKPASRQGGTGSSTSKDAAAQTPLEAGLAEAMASLAQRYLDSLAGGHGKTIRFDPPEPHPKNSKRSTLTWPTPPPAGPSPQTPAEPAVEQYPVPPASPPTPSQNGISHTIHAAHGSSVPQPHWEPSQHIQALTAAPQATATTANAAILPIANQPVANQPIGVPTSMAAEGTLAAQPAQPADHDSVARAAAVIAQPPAITQPAITQPEITQPEAPQPVTSQPAVTPPETPQPIAQPIAQPVAQPVNVTESEPVTQAAPTTITAEPRSPATAEPTAEEIHPESTVAWEPPAFEVDRLAWPNVCEKLGDAARAGLHRTARHILDGADEDKNVVLVTGQQHSEGRTTTALCLAAELSAMSKTVVVVDANFENPALANRVGVAPQCGWEDVILDGLSLSDALIESLEDRLTILPLTAGKRAQTSPTEDAYLSGILETLRTRFDVVIVDGPPIDHHHKSTALLENLGSSVDTAVLLHTDIDESDATLSAVVSQLLNSGIEPLGIIRNTLPEYIAG